MSLSRYPRYPAYKDSGVEWLREVPAHWKVRRLQYVADVNPVDAYTSRLPLDTEVSFVPMEAVGEYGGLRLDNTTTVGDTKAGYTHFRDNDVLVAKITPCFENGKGALARGLVNGQAFGTTELHVLRPGASFYAGFLFYLSISRPFRLIGEAAMYGAGGQKRISDDFVRNFRSAFPNVSEQRQIATFLDRETARIDALIDKKRKLIELLHEQRAAIITRAVTRGLDPHAPTKNSGVEWLGEIPANWEVKRIKFLAKVGNGSTPNRDEPEYWNGDYPWLKSSVVNRDEVVSGADFVTARALRECHLPIIQPPAVLMGITGEGRTRGMASVLRLEATISQHVAAIHQPKSGVSVDYVRYVLVAAYKYLRELSSGAGGTKAALTCVQLGDFEIPLPLLEVQHEIVADLRSRLSSIDKVGQCIASAIAALSELRSSLITAAVTGAIDVRASLDADARIDAA